MLSPGDRDGDSVAQVMVTTMWTIGCFRLGNPDFGFHNKTRNPFSDFDRQKSFFRADFVEQWEIEIRISQSKAPIVTMVNNSMVTITMLVICNVFVQVTLIIKARLHKRFLMRFRVQKRALPYPARKLFSRSIAWIGKKVITSYLKAPFFPISANLAAPLRGRVGQVLYAKSHQNGMKHRMCKRD